jgi:hypothetical protein
MSTVCHMSVIIKVCSNFWAKRLWTCVRESAVSIVRTPRSLNFVCYCLHKFIIKTLQAEETQKLSAYINMRTARRKKLSYVYWHKVVLNIWQFFDIFCFRSWCRQAKLTTAKERLKAASIYVRREPLQLALYTDIYKHLLREYRCLFCAAFSGIDKFTCDCVSLMGTKSVWYAERLIGVCGHVFGEWTRV